MQSKLLMTAEYVFSFILYHRHKTDWSFCIKNPYMHVCAETDDYKDIEYIHGILILENNLALFPDPHVFPPNFRLREACE